ncbi:MAG: LCP family protein [Pseudanabaenaceae cyanobacterium bins.68]|nr:LCP family protein [Pseudanabaenaceae cyanobacterium bins.68]
MSGSRRSRRKFPWFKLFCLGILVCAMASLIGFNQVIPLASLDWSAVFQGKPWQQVLLTAAAKRLDRSYQILVMGVDQSNSPAQAPNFDGRADTILLAKFAPQPPHLEVLGIPRDTQVVIAGFGRQKVNAANVYGGINLAKQTIRDFLGGVRIDHHVRLSTAGLVTLIDAIGGIEVDVPTAMQYQDQTQGLKIDLQPGQQTLSGQQAEGLIRYRNDGNGDIGRVSRQQLVLQAIKAQLGKPWVWLRMPQILAHVTKYLDTDLSQGQISSLATFVLTLPKSAVAIHSLEGRPSGANEFNYSYWIVNQEQIDQATRGKFEPQL